MATWQENIAFKNFHFENLEIKIKELRKLENSLRKKISKNFLKVENLQFSSNARKLYIFALHFMPTLYQI